MNLKPQWRKNSNQDYNIKGNLNIDTFLHIKLKRMFND